MRRVLLLATATAFLAACLPRATLPDAERERISALTGQRRFVRVALYAGPLWSDTTKMFLTDQPAGELDLVETTGGEPIPPPKPVRVLAPGTPVSVEKVEFPTGWLIASRVVMTPRYHPWAYLKLAGDDRPYVVVLSQTVASADEVRTELDRVVSTDDPAGAFAALPQDQRDAILRKEPVEGMGPRALEMAWGQPEKKRIDRPAGTEEWFWPGGKRRATLQDEKVVRWDRG